MRIIAGHRIFGEDVAIWAMSEAEAKVLATKNKDSDWYAWEAIELYPPEGDVPGMFAVYIAKADAVFALND